MIGEPSYVPIRRRRILLSAFACDPFTGSEPYVGWNWANHLSKRHNVTVLTRKYSARLISQSEMVRKFDLISFDLPGCSRFDHYHRFIKLYYIAWQLIALLVVLYKQVSRRFEIVHHLTYNVIDMPGFLALVPGVKFVWGPVGGGQVPPTALKSVYGGAWRKQIIRGALKRFAWFNPLVRFAAFRARHVFFANQETAALISRGCRNYSILLETAIDPQAEDGPKGGRGLSLLWLGNVIDRKALIIAIEALGKLLTKSPDCDVKLTVAGDGPELERARARGTELGIAHRIVFLGRVSFANVRDLMKANDLFLFTSVQDTSGNVLLEAMSCGRAVICLDHQGAAAIVNHSCGVKVPIGSFDQVTQGFADAIEELANDRDRVRELGAGAYREISSRHSWDHRMTSYEKIICAIAP